MRKKYWIIVFVLTLAISMVFIFFSLPEKNETHSATQNEVVNLVFALDKKFEFGEYYFDITNGKDATYPLCFCLSEKNMFPPDCKGDVTYIYNNTPGAMCVPMHIGKGSCGSEVISSSSFATMFTIPLEYGWTKPYETIVIGIQVPENAPAGAKLVVEVTLFKRADQGNLVPYRTYTQQINVKNKLS